MKPYKEVFRKQSFALERRMSTQSALRVSNQMRRKLGHIVIDAMTIGDDTGFSKFVCTLHLSQIITPRSDIYNLL